MMDLLQTSQNLVSLSKMIPMKLFVILFASLLFFACANEPKKVEPTNPNGDSELALLMRKMENHWKTAKKAVEEGRPVETPDFSSILSAKPTDGSMKMPSFDGFAEAYLAQIETLKETDKGTQKKSYNNIINACIVCHENSCSGPIPRIQKLLISQ